MTDEIFYEGELNEKRITTYKKLADNYRVQESTVRDIFSQGITFACTHTQAHTEGLREELKETQNIADASTSQLKRLVGKYNKLREKAKELETTLSINRYTIEDMRKSFYAGHSLCDDEWRDKTKLTGFDEFIDNLK